jgi:hypothetical protein
VADKNGLRFFERRIFRKISGPVWYRGEWRVQYNVELNGLVEGHYIIRFVKAQNKVARTCGENVRATDAQKNVEGGIILQKKKGLTKYKMAGKCGDVCQEPGEDRAGFRRVLCEANVHEGL